MLATARLTGMTVGASLTALVFHTAASDAEHLCLLIGVGIALAGAVVSVSRLKRRATATVA